jgi:antiviral helicase SKI2
MIDLLKRGIAIHHSGILPILREMVELLFAKGCIKVLFATETFAVGVNMPAKTVLFTSLQKYTSNDFRYLLSHEYTQMAGRAGRRGLDKIGVVIHLLNMFNDIPVNSDYKHIVDGNSQQLISKFKIHSNLLLRIIYNNQDTENFITSSMITSEIKNEFTTTENFIVSLKEKRNKLHNELKYYDDVLKYTELIKTIENSKNKKRKRALQDVSNYEKDNQHIVKEYEKYKKIIMKRKN